MSYIIRILTKNATGVEFGKLSYGITADVWKVGTWVSKTREKYIEEEEHVAAEYNTP